MEKQEAQDEELVVLDSVYAFDGTYVRDDDTSEGLRRFRIRVVAPSAEEQTDVTHDQGTGEEESGQSTDADLLLLVEVTLPLDYPDVPPQLSLDSVVNCAVPDDVKAAVLQLLADQAAELAGEAMMFQLVELLRQEVPPLIQASRNAAAAAAAAKEDEDKQSKDQDEDDAMMTRKEERAAQRAQGKLSKAQKRRLQERFGAGGAVGSRPRGWNWVDLISHLSKTGTSSSAR